MSKYNNTRSNGFDSKREERRYNVLRLQELKGEITGLKRQVPYELIPVQREPDRVGPRGGLIRGKVIERSVTYIADFVYYRNGELVVEDSKGFRTAEYRLKRKLMLWVHGIRIKET
jgi:hypothetical protein